jgi:DNA primase
MTATKARTSGAAIPNTENTTVRVGSHVVQLTNLDKVFWPELGLTKQDLLRYYADVSAALRLSGGRSRKTCGASRKHWPSGWTSCTPS